VRRGRVRSWSNERGGYNIQRRSAEKGAVDHEDDYKSLVNHGDWVEVTRRRNKTTTTSRVQPRPTNQHRANRTVSWGNKADITTFYFSRFPTWVNEKDLWQTFQRWGKVWEVFIPKHKNREGQRFGFVRYKDVDDVERLERKLDNSIFFGRMKMFVNQPKFERSKEAIRKQNVNIKADNANLQAEVRRSQGGSKTNVNGGRLRSYAEVVKALSPGTTNLCHQKPESSQLSQDVQTSVVLDTTRVQNK